MALRKDGSAFARSTSCSKIVSILFALSLYACMGLNDSFWTPFLTTELEKLGITRVLTGVIISATTASILCCSFLFMFSKSTDDFTARCILFTLGSFTIGFCSLVFGQMPKLFSGYVLFGFLVLIKILMGSGTSLLWCSGVPLIISLFPNWTGRLCSWVSLSMAFGYILGAPTGSALFKVGSLDFAFALIGSIQMALAIFCYLSFQYSHPPKTIEKDNESLAIPNQPQLSAREFLRNPSVLIICLAATFTATSFGFLAVSFSPHLRDTYKVNSVEAGRYFLPFTVTRAVAACFSGYFTDKGFGGLSFCLFGCGFNVISFGLLGLSPFTPWINNILCLEIITGMIGISSTSALVPLIPLIRKLFAGRNMESVIDRYAAVMYQLCFGLGNITGTGVIGGFLVSHVGFYNSCLVIASLCAVAGSLGCSCLLKKNLVFTKLNKSFALGNSYSSHLNQSTTKV